MKPRTRAREVALQILYGYEATPPPSDPAELARELAKHFDHFEVPPASREFAAELVAGTLKEKALIDPLLEAHAQRWKVSRMSAIDRSLLRMAVYELKHFEDIPLSVTLDEAVELAKQFGGPDTSSFVNGILDAIGRELRKPA